MSNQRMAIPSSDRISLLPDCLLELILVLLPLQEAVRTSVLSRRWRLLWTQIPKIVLDKLVFQSIRNKNRHCRLMPIVLNILSCYREPLHDFTFSLSDASNFDIGQLVYTWTSDYVEYFKLDDELYELLSCNKLHSLKRLRLEACICTSPGGFRGFNMLTNLSLFKVDIDGHDLSDLVSKCRLLDTLTLTSLPFCKYLDLVAPNLRVFDCNVFLLGLSFDFTPRLEKMFVSLDDTSSDDPEDIVVPFGSIPSIKYMELNGCFLKYMNRCEQKISRSRDVLNHLIHIKLIDVSFEEIEVGQNVLSLIRRSPNLQTILVSACSRLPYFEPVVGVWPFRSLSDVSLNGLRYVCMANITRKQIEFIGMLLSKSPMLEILDLLLHCELTDEEALGVAEEIGRFQNASPQLSIKFNKAPYGN